MKLNFSKQLENKLSHFLENQYLEISTSKNGKYGDYSLNLAMKVSNDLERGPMDIAEEIVECIKDLDFITNVNATNPGFVNFSLTNEFIIQSIRKLSDESFKPDFEVTRKHINYEFVSANPTGDLHIGHLRNAVVGDVVSNILTYLGHNVVREYWINDYGNQITTLAESVYFYLSPLIGKEQELEEENVGYHGKEIVEYANIISKTHRDEFQELNLEESIAKLKDMGIAYYTQNIKDLLKKIKVKDFYYWTSEKEMFESGKVDKAIKLLEDAGALYDKDGAKWLRSEVYGDDKDRVLIKEDGNSTYMAGDIANHIQKYERGYDEMYNLWGADHHGYQTRILASISFLKNDPNKLEVDFISMVSIENKGEKMKMSKRAGTSLRIKDIIEMIPVDVARYFIISKSKEQNLSIDINKIETESQDNPYYYAQYSHARATQLISKYIEKFGEIKEVENFKHILNSKEERVLGLKLFEFGDAIIQAAKEREPFILITYIKELAQTFNSFYGGSKIIDEELELANEKIQLVLMTKEVMKRIFELIGIEPIERM